MPTPAADSRFLAARCAGVANLGPAARRPALCPRPGVGIMLGMAPRVADEPDPFAETRMTIGEHLDELRRRLIRSLLAFVAACVLCIWPAKHLLGLIARPVVLVLRRHGQPDSFLQTSPIEAILIYVKVVIFAALVISGPYIIYQIWQFVAAGLYRHERKWVYRLVPLSVGLFFAGVAFMYIFALLMALNFLVGFAGWLPAPHARPTAIERALLRLDQTEVPTTQPGLRNAPAVPIFEEDPEDAPPGAMWFNVVDQEFKLRGRKQTYSVQLIQDDKRSLVTTHFKIGEYLTFVLILTLAFGLAFQMPLVVVFLVRTGIVPVETFRRYRKVVILIIVIIAGMLAPPDLFSHLLLSGPMILLFELGLIFARRGPRRSRAA